MALMSKRKIEMTVAPIVSMEDGSRTAFCSQIRIHDRELGILLPDTYGPVTDKTVKSKQLFFWGLNEAVHTIKNLMNRELYFDFLSLYAPQKLFEDDKAVENLIGIIELSELHFGKFALEVYPDFLLDRNGKAAGNVAKLHEKGINIILLQFASENFPVSKISFLPVDILSIDRFLLECLNGTSIERTYAEGVLKTVKGMGKMLLCSQVETRETAELLKSHIDLGAGSYFGNFINNKHINQNFSFKQ